MYDEQEIEQLKMEWDLIDGTKEKDVSSSCNVNQLEKHSDRIKLMTYEGGGEYSILGAQRSSGMDSEVVVMMLSRQEDHQRYKFQPSTNYNHNGLPQKERTLTVQTKILNGTTGYLLVSNSNLTHPDYKLPH
jgi:hypothetical protein